ncbi:MAG TPA: serine hydroxymethyltransferase, partial [Chitinispirillaceae bacterium]|nr:serine hydroxymethyltransferase [Chitinispirillaceae bacterium]
ISGKEAAVAMEKAGLILNYNTVPGETRKASDPSGIRLGTPSVTSRGFGSDEMKKNAEWMELACSYSQDNGKLEAISKETSALCERFAVPGIE